jgi:hypothetical protein
MRPIDDLQSVPGAHRVFAETVTGFHLIPSGFFEEIAYRRFGRLKQLFNCILWPGAFS